MNEAGLKAAVKRLLPKSIHVQSMTSASLSYGGTPDWYVDGATRDMWVEWKQLPSMPRSGYVNVAPLPNKKKQPQGRLSTLQLEWLERRRITGNNVVVIVGLPNKSAVIMTEHAQWIEGVSTFESKPLKEIANWIVRFCGA